MLKKVGARRAGGDGDPDPLGEPLGQVGGAEQGVDGRGSAKVRHALFLEELPYKGVIDLAKADVRAPDGADGPGEGPSHGMEPALIRA